MDKIDTVYGEVLGWSDEMITASFLIDIENKCFETRIFPREFISKIRGFKEGMILKLTIDSEPGKICFAIEKASRTGYELWTKLRKETQERINALDLSGLQNPIS